MGAAQDVLGCGQVKVAARQKQLGQAEISDSNPAQRVEGCSPA